MASLGNFRDTPQEAATLREPTGTDPKHAFAGVTDEIPLSASATSAIDAEPLTHHEQHDPGRTPIRVAAGAIILTGTVTLAGLGIRALGGDGHETPPAPAVSTQSTPGQHAHKPVVSKTPKVEHTSPKRK